LFSASRSWVLLQAAMFLVAMPIFKRGTSLLIYVRDSD
jgi:hypothetical protein